MALYIDNINIHVMIQNRSSFLEMSICFNETTKSRVVSPEILVAYMQNQFLHETKTYFPAYVIRKKDPQIWHRYVNLLTAFLFSNERLPFESFSGSMMTELVETQLIFSLQRTNSCLIKYPLFSMEDSLGLSHIQVNLFTQVFQYPVILLSVNG